jgi:hypothetical protein
MAAVEFGCLKEHSMYSKSQFYALEVMCRERAAVAAKELEYWLAEAEEWARVRNDAMTETNL